MTGTQRESFERALRWYPRSWREKNADAALATLLDLAEAEGRVAPRRGELANLAVNGLIVRAGIVLPASVRDPAASFALATGAAFALVMLVGELRGPWRERALLAYPGEDSFGVFDNTGVIVYGLWLIAFVLTILKRTGASRLAVVLAMLASILFMILRFALWTAAWVGPTSSTIAFLFVTGVIVLIGRSRSRRVLGVQSGAVFAIIVVLCAVNWPSYPVQRLDTFFWWRPASDYNVGVGLVLVLLLGLGLAAVGRRRWAEILILSALPWFAEFLAFKAGHAQDGWLFSAVAAVAGGYLGLILRRLIARERPPQPLR